MTENGDAFSPQQMISLLNRHQLLNEVEISVGLQPNEIVGQYSANEEVMLWPHLCKLDVLVPPDHRNGADVVKAVFGLFSEFMSDCFNQSIHRAVGTCVKFNQR